MSFWMHLKQKLGKPGSPAPPEKAKQPLGLTPRETEVFRLLLEGYTLQETANQLGVKYSTANTHMTSIYKKLGVNSRAELIIRYHTFEKETEP